MAYLEEYLTQQYAEFIQREVRAGKHVPTKNEFARWLGIPNSTLSNLITGQRPPTWPTAVKLSKRLGQQVFDLCGMPRAMPDDPDLKLLAGIWHRVPDEKKGSLAKLAVQYAEEDAAERGKQKERTKTV